MLYSSICLLVVFLLLLLVLIYWNLVRTAHRLFIQFRRQGVPTEPFVPVIGQLPKLYQAFKDDQLIDLIGSFIAKHGYYFLIGFGPLARLFVIEPDMIADILHRSHAHDYVKPTDFATVFEPLIGSKNLLVSEGQEHDHARKMINPAFYFNHLKGMTSIMIEQTSASIDELLAISESQRYIDLQKQFSTMTLAIIMSSAFGTHSTSQTDVRSVMGETLPKMLAAIEYRSLRMINQVPLLAKLPICQKNIVDEGSRNIARVVDRLIVDRREGRSSSLSSNSDLLDLLLSAVDSEGVPFNDQEIKDQAMTFVFAGHETTGNLMTWIAYVLMTNANVLEACQNEIDRILPNGTQLTDEHLVHLNVCEAVVQEALRLYPPAPFIVRQCVREHTIGSESQRQLLIPEEATIIIGVYDLHRRSDFWPRPFEFDYTRWLRDPVSGFKPTLTHPFCYLPFGAGPRNCIGQNFALLEAKIILASLVQRCRLELEPGQKVVPDTMLTLRMKYGLKAKVNQR